MFSQKKGNLHFELATLATVYIVKPFSCHSSQFYHCLFFIFLLINKSISDHHVKKCLMMPKKTITKTQWNRNGLKFSFKLSKSVKDWSFNKIQVKSLKNIQKKLNRFIEWDYFHFYSKEANVVQDVEKFFKNLRKLLNLRIKGVTRLFFLLFKPF